MRLRTLAHKLHGTQHSKVRQPPKVAEPFYSSYAWRTLVEQIKQSRWPRLLAMYGHCCEDRECTAVHSRWKRIFFDHIIERKDNPNLALDASNIIGRCGSSHTKKTAQSRANRYRSSVVSGG